MSEAKLLRTLADKLDCLEALTQYPEDISEPGTLTVSWTAGNDHPGYEVLNAAISELVAHHWNALRGEAVRQREMDVHNARLAVSDAQTTPERIPSSVPEALIRKVVG